MQQLQAREKRRWDLRSLSLFHHLEKSDFFRYQS